MRLTSQTLADLLEAFRSTDPTPGGGSASALAGAVGASLLAMVAVLPKPRAETHDDRARLQLSHARATAHAKELEALIDRDSEAYELVVNAFRLPKGTDAEKAARSEAIQTALQAAIAAPLDVMRECAAAIAEGPVVMRLGNPNASSDVQVGLELLRAGLRGARLNVEINLGSVKDPEYAARIAADVARLSESGAGGAPTGSA
jgi:formiminotetrahydrofolate cyclodeaminase